MSTAIKDIEYDRKHHTLTVHFVSGGSHSYGNVSAAQAKEFQQAGSLGKHFNAHIRQHSPGKGGRNRPAKGTRGRR